VALTYALIDSGPLVSYYNKNDHWHSTARHFFETFRGSLISTESVATEVMWLLNSNWQVQNEFLSDLHKKLYQIEALIPDDFKYIAELNEKYKDLPGDFADLSIVALSHRLAINNVVSLDSDFDIYKRYGKQPFNQLFPKWRKK